MFRLHVWSISVDSPYFLNKKKFRETKNAEFCLVLEKSSEKSRNTLTFLFCDKSGQ